MTIPLTTGPSTVTSTLYVCPCGTPHFRWPGSRCIESKCSITPTFMSPSGSPEAPTPERSAGGSDHLHRSPVDRERRPRDPPRARRGEERDHRGDVLGRPHSPERHPIRGAVAERLQERAPP